MIGFDVKGAGKIVVKQPNYANYTNIIDDTREGWVQSIKTIINSYLLGDVLPQFDYSVIRPYGEPIKTFGGVASGAEPLKKLHQAINETLKPLIGKPITERAITDIMNHIGVCVVAGNVRRTAEIAFGESEEFINLKNYELNPDRAAYGWTSNNSIFAKVGQDYTNVSKITAKNGEPGYFWLENARKFSRLCDKPDFKDSKVKGSNPCGEQSLETYELCNLVETYPINHESIEDYLVTLKYAYLLAKTVSLVPTHDTDTNEVLLRNRRIGLSQSGIVQFIDRFGLDYYKELCMEGYKTVEHYDDLYSGWLKVPKSVKYTSIKPSGSVSLLAGVTPGMHYPESRFYIRRINVPKTSHLMQPIKDAGYFYEDSVYDQTNYSVQIPVFVDCNRTINDVSAWEQASLSNFIQKYWADNQVSCTVTFKPEEAGEIKNILNFIQYESKGISFLPKTEKGVFEQMPYEETTLEKYKELVEGLKPLDFSYLSAVEAIGEKFCSNDSCTI